VHGRRGHAEVPGLLAPRWGLAGRPAARPGEDLRALPPLDPGLVCPDAYPFPAPVIDLRMSRGCPWNRCAFCAITAHQAGYRARPVPAVVRDIDGAHRALGASFFRFRDDLLTPRQLRELAGALPALGFRPRWTARARFEANLTRDTLAAAAAAGLEELWLGLEAASPRVRDRMDKGVSQPVVERVLRDAAELGIRVRILCMVGYRRRPPTTSATPWPSSSATCSAWRASRCRRSSSCAARRCPATRPATACAWSTIPRRATSACGSPCRPPPTTCSPPTRSIS
jgi:hypothetical protein